ncbi:MAG: Lrp/AsnC ligand binding domain-containing protein [Myxococcales bacterium]|nr:Lrp/AsnC ligand binding domain-containing protein [Myxococcales bacterium]
MADKNTWNAWVWVRWKAGTPTTAWEVWQGNDWIEQAWTTQGQWDACLQLKAASHEELEQFVWKHVRSNEWVSDTRTMWAKKWW